MLQVFVVLGVLVVILLFFLDRGSSRARLKEEDLADTSVRYWVYPLNEAGLLRAMMEALAGNAYISFEGNLSTEDFPQHLRPSSEQTENSRRQVTFPRMGFVVLPLEPETVSPILDVVLPEKRFMTDIIHIQIERHGELQFGSYDNFHNECVVCYDGVETALLDRLKSAGVIQSWEVATAGKHRWHD